MEDVTHDESADWAGHELVEAVVDLQERTLRNLCLAAEAQGSQKTWHLNEAAEVHQAYIDALAKLKAWLAERGADGVLTGR